MAKRVTLQVVIIVAVLAIVLPLVFLATPITVAETIESIDINTAYKFLSFDLKNGQTVKGSYTIAGSNKTYCYILTPNGDEMSASPSYYRYSYGTYATFSFTADMNGQYYFCISNMPMATFKIKYSYSISAPPILGLDPVVLIGLVIAVGVILELIVFLKYRVKSEKT
jgi:hypothetical protein